MQDEEDMEASSPRLVQRLGGPPPVRLEREEEGGGYDVEAELGLKKAEPGVRPDLEVVRGETEGSFIPLFGEETTSEEARTEKEEAPWLERSTTRSREEKNVLVRLHDEVLSFCDLIALTEEETASREKAVEATRSAAKEAFGDAARMEVFGSELTKLTLPTSDIDVVVFNAPTSPYQTHLRTLESVLKKNAGVSNVEVVDSARVPLVKFELDGHKIDVSFDVDSGLRTARIVADLASEIPALRPLTLVLKQFLADRELNETYSGGVGSFALQMMIASFLQMRHRVDCASGVPAPYNLGSLLLEFFELYGLHFEATVVGISVRSRGAYFRKKDVGWLYPNRTQLLAIENPDDPSADVGKNSFHYATRVRRAFTHAYSSLLAAMSRPATSSILAAVIDPNDPVLARRTLVPGAFQALVQLDFTSYKGASGAGGSTSKSKSQSKSNDDDDDDDARRQVAAKRKHRAGKRGKHTKYSSNSSPDLDSSSGAGPNDKKSKKQRRHSADDADAPSSSKKKRKHLNAASSSGGAGSRPADSSSAGGPSSKKKKKKLKRTYNST